MVVLELVVDLPLGVAQERLQELAGHAPRLVLGEELGDLVGGDSAVHLLLPCICRQTALHPRPHVEHITANIEQTPYVTGGNLQPSFGLFTLK